ncbi:MAG: hypothetical protein Alpg2KO_04410 [Alphaproteobacteria bacterium]
MTGQFAAAPVQAAPNPVKGWALPQATKDETTGKTQYCAVEALYDNTTVLVLARAINDANSIGIGVPTKETFPEGATLKATVQVDGGTVRKLGASALTPYLASIGTGQDDKLWTELKRGNVLKIRFPEQDAGFDFTLKGSSKAMGHVELCLAGKPIPKPTPRPAAATRAPAQPQALPPNMDPKIEQVLASISGLLQAAGVQKATFRLPTAASETSVAELFWVIPNELSADPGQAMLGGLYDDHAPGKSFEDLTNAYVAKMKDKCPGAFSDQRGKQQSRGPATWQTADMACTGDNGANSVALLFFKKGNDFSVFFHEEPASGNGAVFDLRDRLTAVVTQTLASE